jgi:hypothetical protein
MHKMHSEHLIISFVLFGLLCGSKDSSAAVADNRAQVAQLYIQILGRE